MKSILLFLLITSVNGYMCYSQTFPGGVKPLESRLFVEEKLPPKKVDYPTDVKLNDENNYSVAIDVTVQGVVLTNIRCYFQSRQLISVYYEFKNKTDKGKILTALKKKYSSMTCDDTRITDCFKGKDMTIEVADEYMIYRAVKDSEF